MNLPSALGGFAGACALSVLNETIKKIDKSSPGMNLLGMNAVAKVVKGPGLKSLVSGGKLKPVSLPGDLLTNTLYFGMADTGNKNKTLLRGTLLGLGAGLGAIALARPLGLDERVGYAPAKTQALTVAWYVVGGLVAAAVINLLSRNNR